MDECHLSDAEKCGGVGFVWVRTSCWVFECLSFEMRRFAIRACLIFGVVGWTALLFLTKIFTQLLLLYLKYISINRSINQLHFFYLLAEYCFYQLFIKYILLKTK